MHKVLIIEDDPMYRKIYTRKFEVSGYTVETAENGAMGLEKMRSFVPDIVFVDLMMPIMDGFQFLDGFRADATIKRVPVVVLTNLSTTGDSEKVIQKGAAALLVKSDTEPTGVVQKADELLGKQEPPAAEPPPPETVQPPA